MKTVEKNLLIKITALFCVLCTVLSFSFVSAASDSSEVFGGVFCGENGIIYSLDAENSTAAVCLGSTGVSSVTIPETVTVNGNTYTVTSVSDGAFAENTVLSEVILPETVTHIGSRAFFACVSLKSVTADCLKALGTDVFTGTPFAAGGEFVTLGEVLVRYNGKSALVKNVPENVSFVADAFAWNPYVKTVILPENVTAVGDGAFACAENLRTVSLPFSLEKIGNKAFFACVSLKEISIASNVTKIGESAFSGTPFLADLTEKEGDMIILGGGVLLRYKGEDENVTAPSGIVSISDAFAYASVKTVTFEGDCEIGRGAFRNAESLSRVTVKGNCVGIDSFAFSGCDSLDALVFAKDFSGTVENGAFANASKNLCVYFRSGSIGLDAFTKAGIPAVSPEDIKG